MKLPFKPIAILVIISLLGIFIYQAYWITGLYKTMKHELEQSIVEAMRMSDYNEMMLRVKAMQKENKAHGSVEVSAGYNSDSGKSSLIDEMVVLLLASRIHSLSYSKPRPN